MEPVDRAELAAALHRGDRGLFAHLVQEHQRSVFFLAMRLSNGDEQLSRDIVQKSFLQAWGHRQSFRGDASFKTWLLRIAKNLCLNELRRAWRQREVVAEPSDSGSYAPLGGVDANVLEQLSENQQRALLQEAVAELPERQRLVAILRLYHDLSFAEVAEICGITANNAKVNFHHAVRNIRKHLALAGVAA